MRQEKLEERLKKAKLREQLLSHPDFIELLEILEKSQTTIHKTISSTSIMSAEEIYLLRGRLQALTTIEDWLFRPIVLFERAQGAKDE